MNRRNFLISQVLFLITLFVLVSFFRGGAGVIADEQSEILSKEKNLTMTFNEENPEGSLDLGSFEKELARPDECNQNLVYCKIEEVSFDITLRKQWLKLSLRELNNYDFANTVPRLENSIDQLEKSEIVLLQETLARRGLLTHLDGSTVYDRGFFGSLTSLALIRLAHIKGLDPGDPDYNDLLRDEINNLLDNMASDQDYVNNKKLPSEEHMTPEEGDALYEQWKNNNYLADLAQNSEKVETGNILIDDNIDVSIDGYVNIERVEN